jgi:hypothetical protein
VLKTRMFVATEGEFTEKYQKSGLFSHKEVITEE